MYALDFEMLHKRRVKVQNLLALRVGGITGMMVRERSEGQIQLLVYFTSTFLNTFLFIFPFGTFLILPTFINPC
jgi:hypothetical protein